MKNEESQANITAVVEMQSKPLPLSPGLLGGRGHSHFAQIWP